jgi:hypothetical protein
VFLGPNHAILFVVSFCFKSWASHFEKMTNFGVVSETFEFGMNVIFRALSRLLYMCLILKSLGLCSDSLSSGTRGKR